MHVRADPETRARSVALYYSCPSARAVAHSRFMPRHDRCMVLFVLPLIPIYVGLYESTLNTEIWNGLNAAGYNST